MYMTYLQYSGICIKNCSADLTSLTGLVRKIEQYGRWLIYLSLLINCFSILSLV